MKKFQLRFWHPIAAIALLNGISVANDSLHPNNAWEIINELILWAFNICVLLLLYIIIRNIIRAVKGLIARQSSSEAEELEHQREIERKEIDMVRKSNEILLHLIQDEHREKGDR